MGHGGTLDSFATGVMIIGVGSQTKALTAFLEGEKEYVAKGIFGIETETLDPIGKVTKELPYSHISKDKLLEVLNQFKGVTMQKPPSFSAKNISGQRAYELALRGVDVQSLVKERQIEISRLDLLSFEPPYFDISITCSGGTYVRSLIADISKKLDW